MKTILMIDDNLHFCTALGKIIGSRMPGIAIDRASDGTQGLEKVAALLPNLVFIDIHLPGENGLKLVHSIKAINPATIVIAFTSYDLPEYRSAMGECGVDHLVPKDAWTGEEMLDLVESILSAGDHSV
jgi:DNA-binding NarL/FixJ family response regulator